MSDNELWVEVIRGRCGPSQYVKVPAICKVIWVIC